MDAKTHLTINQFADRSGLPVGWLRREIKSGNLPAIRAGRRLYIVVAEAERVLLERAYASQGDGHDIE